MSAPQRFRLERPCPKCGTGPTPSVFCTLTRPWSLAAGKNSFHAYVPEGDHLHRKCLHCGYERIELAMDTPLMSDERREAAIAALVAERDAEYERVKSNWPATSWTVNA